MGSKRLDKSDSTLHSPKIPFVSANRSWDIVEDPELFVTAFDNLIVTAAKTAKGKHPHVAVFGECVHLLWAQGNAEAAIRMEKLGVINSPVRTTWIPPTISVAEPDRTKNTSA